MKNLKITVEYGTENLFVGFPFQEDQYEETTEITNDDGSFIVYVNLGDREGTTSAQDQFLNTHPNVINYEVVEMK